MNNLILLLFSYRNSIILLFLFALTNRCNAVSTPTCLDFNGKSVEWYICYVVPKTATNPNVQIPGTYFYLDPNNLEGVYNTMVPVTNSMSAPGRTIQQIYNSHASESGWTMYNDQISLPLKALKAKHNSNNLFKHENLAKFYKPFAQQKAHAKGVIQFTSIGGFWLVHSVPKYPPSYPGPYGYTTSKYGQTYICISVNIQTINLIGKLQQVNYPAFYSTNIPISLAPLVPNLVLAIKATSSNNISMLNYEFTSISGAYSFMAFAKSIVLDGDLYSKVVAPTLKSSLMVETWKRTSPLASCCPNGTPPNQCSTSLRVENVLNVTLGSGTVSFKYTKDHSKWAISVSSYTCIGDINREASQSKRGGGTLCLLNSTVQKWFHDRIALLENC